jgi:GntR family transcriptional regulator
VPVRIQVDPNSGVPVFRQIVEQVRFHIAAGVLKPGEEVPSTRALSQYLGVNPMTVSKAYVLLEQEGLIERRAGLPLIVRDVGVEEIDEKRLEVLRAALAPASVIAKQLGVSPTRAIALFRHILAAPNEEEEQ